MYSVTAKLRQLAAVCSLRNVRDSLVTSADTRIAELGHITAWAADNNLRLNGTKLRHHGLGEAGLQTVFRAVVVSRLTYAASAWFGFITSTNKQRIEAFFRRSK